MDAAAPPTPASLHPAASGDPTNVARTTISILSIVLLSFVLMQYLFLMYIHLFFIPRFLDIFNDFDTELPYITVAIIRLRGIGVFLLFFLFLGGLVAKEFIPTRHPSMKIIINVLAMCLGMLIFMLYFIGLMAPLTKLMQDVM